MKKGLNFTEDKNKEDWTLQMRLDGVSIVSLGNLAALLELTKETLMDEIIKVAKCDRGELEKALQEEKKKIGVKRG